MNLQEITTQVRSEYDRLSKTTLIRLCAEYDRERRKKKISKSDPYPKEYEIKTKGKNNWIVFLNMPPGVKKYAGPWCVYGLSVVYYYGNQGFTAFSIGKDSMVTGYTSHFFNRYNERMKLNLSTTIEVVKAYFRKGEFTSFTEIKSNNNHQKFIGFRSDGILFAEIFNDDYVECKTFVDYELIRPQQKKIKEKLRRELLKNIKEIKNAEAYDFRVLESLLNSAASLSLQNCA